jgi:hypothetical protein
MKTLRFILAALFGDADVTLSRNPGISHEGEAT